MALALVTGLAWQADNSPQGDNYTQNAVNGRFWKQLSDFEKICFISGMNAGVNKLLKASHGKKGIEHSALVSLADKLLFAPQFSFGESRDEITKLYGDDPGNVIVPVEDVYSLAAQALNGVNSDQIKSMMEALRIAYIRGK